MGWDGRSCRFQATTDLDDLRRRAPILSLGICSLVRGLARGVPTLHESKRPILVQVSMTIGMDVFQHAEPCPVPPRRILEPVPQAGQVGHFATWHIESKRCAKFMEKNHIR